MTFANRVSGFNRQRKWQLFLREIAPTESMRVLDVGFAAREFSPADNYIEKHYPYPSRLTALGIDPPAEFAHRFPAIHTVSYAGARFPFNDKEFDVCWSNAVLEHVGGPDRQLIFLQEIARVSRRAFITTPNRFFPIEVHTRTPFLHYLPKSIFDKYLACTGRRWATGNYMHLLSEGEFKRLLETAGLSPYRLFRNRLFGFTADFAAVISDDVASPSAAPACITAPSK